MRHLLLTAALLFPSFACADDLPTPDAPLIRTSLSHQIPIHDPTPTIDVRDLATNAPIADARIRLTSDFSDRFPAAEAVTDSAGSATVPYPARSAGFVIATASAPGYASVLQWSSPLCPSDPAPSHILLRLEKAIPVGGRVLDADGHPLADAVIHALFSKSYNTHTSLAPVTATTDAAGNWSALAPAGVSASLSTSHPACFSAFPAGIQTASAAELAAHTYTLRLPKSVPVFGTVFGPDGKPCKATLAVGLAFSESFTLPTLSTSDDGHFQFNVNPEDHVNLITTYADHCADATTPIDIGTTPIHFDIHLTPEKPMTIHVVDPQNDPLPNAAVVIASWNTGTKRWQRGNVSRDLPTNFRVALLADAHGTITWPDAPAQPLFATITAPGCLGRTNVPLADNLTATLFPQSLIHLHAVSATTGKPITDFWPIYRGQVAHLPDGSYAFAQWDQDAAESFSVTGLHYFPEVVRPLRADGHDYDVTVALTEAEPLTGRLVDAAGAPVSNTLVYLGDAQASIDNADAWFAPESIEFSPHDYATTDAQGNFSFPPQAAGYTLSAITDKAYAFATSATFTTDPTLTLTPWSSIDGTLTIHNVPAPAGISVFIAHTGKPSLNYSATTDAKGHFTFPKVAAATYTCIVQLPDNTVFKAKLKTLPGKPAPLALTAP